MVKVLLSIFQKFLGNFDNVGKVFINKISEKNQLKCRMPHGEQHLSHTKPIITYFYAWHIRPVARF